MQEDTLMAHEIKRGEGGGGGGGGGHFVPGPQFMLPLN